MVGVGLGLGLARARLVPVEPVPRSAAAWCFPSCASVIRIQGLNRGTHRVTRVPGYGHGASKMWVQIRDWPYAP